MARTLFASKKVYPDLKYRIVGILTKIEYLIIKGFVDYNAEVKN